MTELSHPEAHLIVVVVVLVVVDECMLICCVVLFWQSYLIRSKSKKHGESREASPIKSLFSPGGTERRVEEGGEEDVRHLTKELLDLKSR